MNSSNDLRRIGHPNSFGSNINFVYYSGENGHVNMWLFNHKGKDLVMLADQYQVLGDHSIL